MYMFLVLASNHLKPRVSVLVYFFLLFNLSRLESQLLVFIHTHRDACRHLTCYWPQIFKPVASFSGLGMRLASFSGLGMRLASFSGLGMRLASFSGLGTRLAQTQSCCPRNHFILGCEKSLRQKFWIESYSVLAPIH